MSSRRDSLFNSSSQPVRRGRGRPRKEEKTDTERESTDTMSVSAPTTAATTPPPMTETPPDLGVKDEPIVSNILSDAGIKKLQEEEKKAHKLNREEIARERRLAAKKKRPISKEAAEKKAKELDDLLAKSAAFSNLLLGKTQVLSRVGSGMDGKALGQHNLEMAEQPKIMSGGKMRDYQLEGLTWMYEICAQGMSGILADEMGLGKTIQTISLIASLREKESYFGPHLIIAPLSTLSNWIEEFRKWCPSIPVVMYHGNKQERDSLRAKKISKHLIRGRPTEKFPVVLTSYEIILRDKAFLGNIRWEFIIIDEGHRMKNYNSLLFQELRKFTSATRLLITGTPLQNNLKELWSLLNFLLPTVFYDWEAFESWFDFSDLADEDKAEDFIVDQKKHDLIKKIHLILQPLMLRRVKADVENMLPRKREYVLYAPLTEEQKELYGVLSDITQDARQYLENKVVERLTAQNTPADSKANSRRRSKVATPTISISDDSEEELPLAEVARIKKAKAELEKKPATRLNAFERMMMAKKRPSSVLGEKRKSSVDSAASSNKSAKVNGSSTPRTIFSTKKSKRKSYREASPSDEDDLSDDEFESKLAQELAGAELSDEETDDETRQHNQTIEAAKKEMSMKKLGNPVMQLRLVCNSPHNFYNPWPADTMVDETLVTSSGKMLLLDRLLPELFERGHKVLLFSQFKTQLDLIEDYAAELRGWNVCRIDGSVAQDERRQQILDFNTDPDHRLFLLSTRAGGQGINLASADTVILFDSDWNPQQDLQAIDRAHRIGQKRPVVIFRLATKGTIEEDLLMSADAKRRLEKLVIKKGGLASKTKMGDQDLTAEGLKRLLLKEGMVYTYKGGDEILSNEDLDKLCDRSEEAYVKAETGLGDTAGFKVVETKGSGLVVGGEAV